MLLLWGLVFFVAAFGFDAPYLNSNLPLEELANFTNVSPQCAMDMTKWMAGLKEFANELKQCAPNLQNCSTETKTKLKYNLYALKQLDAFGRIPPGLLDLTFTSDGSYTECKQVGSNYEYNTQYCFMSGVIRTGQNANCASALPYKNAVCMPDSCTEQDLVHIFNQMTKLPYTYCSASCVNNDVKPNTFFWIYMSIISFLVVWLIAASVTDYVLETYYGMESKKVKNVYLKILLAFSMYTNASAIMDTKPQGPGHIKCLDCIRFFSMMWVVAGHSELRWMENDSLQRVLTVGKPILADIFTNAFFCVDTFFAISGILVSYMFFKSRLTDSYVKQPGTWILYYVHRYLRLTPPYMLFIAFIIAVGPFIVGPQSSSDELDNMEQMVDICKKYWWQNLLYINNFDGENLCYGSSWYLSADIQMCLVSPVFLIALYFSHSIGLVAIIATIIGSVTANYVLTYKYDLPGTMLLLSPELQGFLFKLYFQPWIRCPPYLIGIYVGYLLAIYRDRKFEMKPLYCVLGWIIATAIALACLFSPNKYLSSETTWNHFQSASYYAWSRIGWAFSISWVVVANHRGWGGPIAKFMDFPMWQPFGRLSYSAYLVHFFIIYYFFNLSDRAIHLVSMWQVYLQYVVPIGVCAYVFAFFWSCLCEIPFLKLEKLAVDAVVGTGRHSRKVQPEKKENGTVKEVNSTAFGNNMKSPDLESLEIVNEKL